MNFFDPDYQEANIEFVVELDKNIDIKRKDGELIATFPIGTWVTLSVPQSAMQDSPAKKMLMQEHQIDFLEAGESVYFPIESAPHNDDQEYKDLKRRAGITNRFVNKTPVEVILNSKCYLRGRPSGNFRVTDVECYIPILDVTAKSLNHAYKLLSDNYETKRISSGGSVYLQGHIFYEGMLVSLNRVRQQRLMEHFSSNPYLLT